MAPPEVAERVFHQAFAKKRDVNRQSASQSSSSLQAYGGSLLASWATYHLGPFDTKKGGKYVNSSKVHRELPIYERIN
jgi:hypothetical protein